MKLVEGFDSNYRYVLVAARRARQIQNGARPVVEPHSRKPCRIAEEELQAGKVKWEIPPLAAKGSQDAAPEMDHPVGGEADD
jgi:DNA-directed RNA polymerase subunit omega